MVNPVIVNTEAYDVDSSKKALKIQNGSPNLQGYASHMLYTSGGSAKNRQKNITGHMQISFGHDENSKQFGHDEDSKQNLNMMNTVSNLDMMNTVKNNI